MIFCWFTFYLNGFSQDYFSRYFDFSGDNDGAWNIMQVNDRYYVYSGNFCHQNTLPCSGLLCFDRNLDLIWKQELDYIAPLYYDCITSDGTYLYVVGAAPYKGGEEFNLLKFDLDGNLIKSNYFGPFLETRIPFSFNYFQNRLYLNLSYFHDSGKSGYDSTQIWVLSTDFDLLYQLADTDKKNIESLLSYLPTLDGKFIGIKTMSFNSREMVGLVKKFDSSGNVLWSTLIGTSTKSPNFSPKILPTSDTCFVVIGSQTIDVFFNDTFPHQPKIYKLDNSGKLLWEHTFYSKRPKLFISLFEAKNGDIIAVGDDENPGKYSRYKVNGWVVRFSPDGKLLWEHSYNDTISWNGYSHFYDGLELDDGSLIFCGKVKPKKDFILFEDSDNWIVHTDANGCILPGCDSFQVLTKIHSLKTGLTSDVRFTNPVANELVVESDFFTTPVTITITDLKSSKILELDNWLLPFKYNTFDLPKGIYLLTIQDIKSHITKTFKFLKT